MDAGLRPRRAWLKGLVTTAGTDLGSGRPCSPSTVLGLRDPVEWGAQRPWLRSRALDFPGFWASPNQPRLNGRGRPELMSRCANGSSAPLLTLEVDDLPCTHDLAQRTMGLEGDPGVELRDFDLRVELGTGRLHRKR